MTSHTCTSHAAGDRNCYRNHRCRCERCTTANTRAVTRSEAGLSRRVPAEVIVRHLTGLGDGLTLQDYATATGVPVGTLRSVLDGRVQSVTQTTARRVLSIRSASRTGAGRYDGTGVRRRLRALAAIGWSPEDLAPRLGSSVSQVIKLRSGVHPWVFAATQVRVLEVWAALSATPNSNGAATRAAAVARGWPPPAAFDDESIDDPHPRIDDAARRAAGMERARR